MTDFRFPFSISHNVIICNLEKSLDLAFFFWYCFLQILHGEGFWYCWTFLGPFLGGLGVSGFFFRPIFLRSWVLFSVRYSVYKNSRSYFSPFFLRHIHTLHAYVDVSVLESLVTDKLWNRSCPWTWDVGRGRFLTRLDLLDLTRLCFTRLASLDLLDSTCLTRLDSLDLLHSTCFTRLASLDLLHSTCFTRLASLDSNHVHLNVHVLLESLHTLTSKHLASKFSIKVSSMLCMILPERCFAFQFRVYV